MRYLILIICVAGLGLLIQQGPLPVADSASYVGLLMVLCYLGGKLFRFLGLPVVVSYIGMGVTARGLGILPGNIFTMGDPFIAMALGWVGFHAGFEIGKMRNTLKPAHVCLFLLGSIVPFVLVTVILKSITGFPSVVVLTLALAASLPAPILAFVTADRIPESVLLTAVCGGFSLLLFARLAGYWGGTLPFILGVGASLAVAVLWAETLARAQASLKEDWSLISLVLIMLVLFQWTSVLLKHSLLLTALAAGALVSMHSVSVPRFERILGPVGAGAGALLLGGFGMQIAVERLAELPLEIWGVAAVYLGSMIGGKLIGGALVSKAAHPYGRLAGIALIPQDLLLLEIDAQVSHRAELFGESADLIHAVLIIAALVGGLALPFLDFVLQRSVLASRETREQET